MRLIRRWGKGSLFIIVLIIKSVLIELFILLLININSIVIVVALILQGLHLIICTNACGSCSVINGHRGRGFRCGWCGWSGHTWGHLSGNTGRKRLHFCVVYLSYFGALAVVFICDWGVSQQQQSPEVVGGLPSLSSGSLVQPES
jgi:hypothetical protein